MQEILQRLFELQKNRQIIQCITAQIIYFHSICVDYCYILTKYRGDVNSIVVNSSLVRYGSVLPNGNAPSHDLLDCTGSVIQCSPYFLAYCLTQGGSHLVRYHSIALRESLKNQKHRQAVPVVRHSRQRYQINHREH